MGAKRYTDEFRIEAVRQVTDQGHRVAEVAERLGITACSLYAWKSQFGKGEVVQRVEAGPERRGAWSQSRVAACHPLARNHKKSRRVLCQGVKAKYAFMPVITRVSSRLMAMCRVLGVQRSGLLRVAAFTAQCACKGRSSDYSVWIKCTRGWTVDRSRWPSQDRHRLCASW